MILVLIFQRLADRAGAHSLRRTQAEAGSILAFFFPFDAIPGPIAANGMPGIDALPGGAWRFAAIRS
jgi:hypothetical protein